MRKLTNFLKFGVLPVLCIALAVGCEKGPKDEGGTNGPVFEKDSVIKLGKTTVNVGVGGGSQLLEYTIENPHQGEKISAEAAADWVNGFNYGITGALQFNVDANDGTEARECLVTVKYRFAEDVVFTVKQGARTNAGFKLENVSSPMTRLLHISSCQQTLHISHSLASSLLRTSTRMTSSTSVGWVSSTVWML